MLRRIGIGAYGEVWMAASITGTLRAVKVVRREHFDHERTYEREFGGLKSFEPISRQHEGLVDILQIGRNDTAGYFYCVMELADDAGAGGDYLSFTLAELIRTRGRMDIADCSRVGAAIAEALEFLHGRGLVHRDVKPSNIIFVNGQPKLADIGLVASVGSARSFVGTDGFIPPEGPGKPAADIYALGKTLYEMAAGRSRLDFPDLPRDLETKGDGVAFVELNEIILKACMANPEDRHASAEELRGELLLLNAGRSIQRLRRNERLLRYWRRVGMAVAVILCGTALALAWERTRAEAARRDAASQARQRQILEEKERIGRANLYAADLNLAQQAIEVGNYGRAEALLSEYLPESNRDDLRGFEWFYLWKRVRGDSIAVLRGHEHVVSTIILGKNPDQLFSASFDTTIREWSLKDRREVHRWALPGSIFTSLALDPSGTKIAAEGDRALSSWLDLETGNWRTNSSTASSQVVFTPDPQKLARGAQFKLFDTNGHTQITDRAFHVEKVLPESGSRVAFSPLANFMATASWYDTIKLWTWPALEPEGVLKGAGVVLCLRFSPDGSKLATVNREGRLCLWDMRTKKLLRQQVAHGGAVVWSVAFAPDGSRLATGGNDQAVRIWETETLRELHVYRGHGSEVWSVLWSADGAHLYSSGKDMTIRVWNAFPVKDAGEIFGGAQRPIVSPDHRLVAAAVRAEGVMVWESASGRLAKRIPNAVDVGGFSRSGKALFVLTGNWDVNEVSMQDEAILSARKVAHPVTDFTKRLLSGDGRWIATGFRNGDVYVCDTHEIKALRKFAGLTEMIVSLAFSPDNTKLLAGSITRTAHLWDLESGRDLNTFDGHRMGIGSLAFSQDGRLIATGSWDDTVQVWDANTWKRLMILEGHEAGVQAVAFSPDNRSLLSLTGTGILKFWSLPAKREAGQIRLHPGVNQGWLALSGDGELLAAVSQSEALTLVQAPREKTSESR